MNLDIMLGVVIGISITLISFAVLDAVIKYQENKSRKIKDEWK